MSRPDPPTDTSVHAPLTPARALAGSAPDHPDGPAAAGRFITFEGIDGAGKSTHLQSLAQALLAAGHAVELTREPGGTPLAESLRDLFLVEPMDALTEALLVFAGRRDHLARRIRPALSAGRFVISDRFTDATFAYQGAGRGFDAQVLAQLECWVQQADDGLGRGGLLQPDLTLWFDLPAETAARRRAAAREADRLEREDIAFFERVRQGYAERASAWPDRVARIDASQAPEAVWRQVQAVVAGRGWL